MPSNLSYMLATLESRLRQVSNPRVACEERCNRTITLQYAQWDDPVAVDSRWSCDASAECGYGNEHFCRFVPLIADGYGSTPEDAASDCLSKLESLLEERRTVADPELEEEDF